MKTEIACILGIFFLVTGCKRQETKVEAYPVKNDLLALGVNKIRKSEIKEAKKGSFKVEALKDDTSVLSLEWTFSINGEEEIWKIAGTRIDEKGETRRGQLTYGTISGTDNLSQDTVFVAAFNWFFKKDKESIGNPAWAGDFAMDGADKLALITKPNCVGCGSPFCNCK